MLPLYPQRGDTPLCTASGNGHLDVVERLLAARVEVNCKNFVSLSSSQLGDTPLCTASGNGHLDVVERLLAARAEVNCKNHDECTPLHVASAHGHVDVVMRLLAAGAEVNSKDESGRSVLSYMSWLNYRNDEDVVALLVAAGALK
mmetsp:Transcript_60361/g.126313  ORF Transcript_60361/g.126313 Transcript_60361/m.126313 type:complete len:145 (-) Transcript_60361:522-956(-)